MILYLLCSNLLKSVMKILGSCIKKDSLKYNCQNYMHQHFCSPVYLLFVWRQASICLINPVEDPLFS